MSIRSKLFATVALPVFAASVAVQPVFADSLMAPFEVAQEGGEELSPEELLLLKQREEEQRRKAEEEQQRAAEEQQRQAEEEQQRAAEEEQRRQAEEEQQRAAEEQQRQAEEEQQRAAEEQQRQAEEEQQRAAEEQQRQAEEEQQRAAEEQQRQAEEEQQRAAEEQQRQAEEEQQRAAEEEQQRQAEEKQQRAAEEEQQRQAEEEQQRAAEEEQQRAAEEEQQLPAEEEQQRAAEEEQQRPAEEEQQRAAEEEQQRPAQEEQQRATEEEQQRPADEEQTAEEPSAATEDETTAEQPAAEEPAEQTGEAEQQPVPEGEEPATAEQMQAEQPEGQPAPEVVDERTVEEKQKIAEDPGATDETILLPVEGGAAVLDSDKDADNIGGNQAREIRRQQRGEVRAQEEAVEPPTDDAAAQSEIPAEFTEGLPQKMEAALSEEGERVEEAPEFVIPETTNIVNNTIVNNTVINNTTTNNVTEVRVVEETENRVILEAGDRFFVRGDDRPRLRRHAEETFYEELPRGRYRETIVRPDGYRVVTVYNRYGDILQRTRIDRDGDEYVLIYAPEYEERRHPAIFDVGYELPPMRLTIPVDDYIVDYAEHPDRDYYEFLSEPPVERVERVYTMDEVRHSARLRDKVRRIDLDTINFATGSAEVSMSQAKTLRRVADAMAKILDQDPGETFFIEGHTDAVGSDRSNLLLSDRRADSVATLLSEVYGIPPENLVTQGYGERFLKIRTPEAEQENRRVTIRRVTPLVRPVAQR